MAVNATVNLRKRRRRRRRQDKPSISAHLVLDDRVKGHGGILSDDFFADLFPAAAKSSGTFSSLAMLLLLTCQATRPRLAKTAYTM